MANDEKSPTPTPDQSEKDEESQASTPDLTALTQQGMTQVWNAFSSYLNALGSAAQGEAEGGNELGNAFANYAGRNVANAVAFAQKLMQVKGVDDLVKAQTDFAKSQMEAVAEQAAVVRETTEKASAERMERIVALAEQVLGDRVKARRWLRRRRRTLNGEMALAFTATEAGAQVVEDMLRRLQPAQEPGATT